MPNWIRVTDKDTGHKITVDESQLEHGNYRRLTAPAVDENGDPLPAEHGAVEPLSSNTNEGPSAGTDTKEK